MSIQITDSELRKALQRITDSPDVREHQRKFGELVASFPHTITFVDDADTGPNGFNCFMYALNIHKAPDWLVTAAHEHDLHPDSCFAAHLIATRMIEASETGRAANGAVAMYFAAGRPKHAGRVENSSVVSKWGRGHVWRHAFAEVPSSYGTKVRFFRAPDPNEVLLAFKTYGERLLGLKL